MHDTQQRDARWGAVTGGVLGLLVMGPLGAAVGAGAGGGLTGWLTGKAVGIPQKDVESIETALKPNTSAIVAVINNKWVADFEKTMRANAIQT